MRLINGLFRRHQDMVPDQVVVEPVEKDRPHYQGHDHIDFFFGYKEEGEIIPEVPPQAFGTARIMPTPLKDFDVPEEYDTLKLDAEWLERTPIAPKSAYYIPRNLNPSEWMAANMADLLEGVKLKGALKKKYKDFMKGARVVAIKPDGTLKNLDAQK